jgi:hypothetical protein
MNVIYEIEKQTLFSTLTISIYHLREQCRPRCGTPNCHKSVTGDLAGCLPDIQPRTLSASQVCAHPKLWLPVTSSSTALCSPRLPDGPVGRGPARRHGRRSGVACRDRPTLEPAKIALSSERTLVHEGMGRRVAPRRRPTGAGFSTARPVGPTRPLLPPACFGRMRLATSSDS